MNASQIHLALTHVPVILSFIGLAILIIAFIRKNDILTKTSYYIFLVAGLLALPVYFTGEGAEETVEELPGISEALISRHELFANISLTIILVCATLSLAGLLLSKYLSATKLIRYVVLAFALGSAFTMAQTAHYGGQIRHSEIRTAFSSAASSDDENGDKENAGRKTEAEKDEKDD